MPDYILAIDQGTTGSTALLVGHDLAVLGRCTVDFPQHYPQPGWVEHDPEEIWSSVRKAVLGLLQTTGVQTKRIAAIGITNQRETTLLWERSDGRPMANAIVWQCRRTQPLCDQLKAEGLEPIFRQQTGLVLDPYFSGTKLAWLLDNIPNLRPMAEAGQLAFGTIDTFLVWRLSGGQCHITDVSNASRTLMMGLTSCAWEKELIEALDIPSAVLPEIRPSSQIYATTQGLDFLPDGIPIAGVAGDQQAALFGQACFEAGQSKCTYGTGAFLLENTGNQPVASRHNLLTTVAWQIDGVTTYALEGSAFIAGAAVQWLRDGLGLINDAAAIESLARQVPDTGGVVFIPALTGLGAPHWRSESRGQISGLTRGTTAAHLARATLEGIALQVYDLIMAMAEDRGEPLSLLKVDGGAAQNNLLMQIQADLIERPVSRPHIVETTALGAAMLAGLAIGFWKDLEELSRSWQEDQVFQPSKDDVHRDSMLRLWQDAIRKL